MSAKMSLTGYTSAARPMTFSGAVQIAPCCQNEKSKTAAQTNVIRMIRVSSRCKRVQKVLGIHRGTANVLHVLGADLHVSKGSQWHQRKPEMWVGQIAAAAHAF